MKKALRIYQSGNTLLVSLVILLTLTVVGLSSITGVSLNQKMATNYRDSDLAFQAAEAALIEAEALVSQINQTIDQSDLSQFKDACSNNCFKAGCEDGLCFDYSTEAADLALRYGEVSAADCLLESPHPDPGVERDTWEDATKYREAEVNFNGLSQKPRYIVEFLCYLDRDTDGTNNLDSGEFDPAEVYRHFRVTAYAKGATSDSEVVLQSTLHLSLPL